MRVITIPDNQKLKVLKESKTPDSEEMMDYTLNEDFFDMLDMGNEDEAIMDQTIEALKIGYEPKIKEWMERYSVDNYKIDYTEGLPPRVDVYGNLNLVGHKLSVLPDFFMFRNVYGDCYMSNNRFTSMSQFPCFIYGSLVCTGNYLTRFDTKITVKEDIVADRQMVRTEYKLTPVNWQKFIHDELNENRVFVESAKAYGYLEGINKAGTKCKVLLESGGTNVYSTDDVNLIDSIKYINKLRHML